MPKYCTAPNCKNGFSNTGSERKSFYKYPLHDPERLQLWLKNMGREEWTPSCHQYLCHEHFGPPCFITRWGVRYLARTAVPTIFDLPQHNRRRKRAGVFERRATQQRTVLMGARIPAPRPGEARPGVAAVHDCDSGPAKLYPATAKSPSPSEDLALPALTRMASGRPALGSGGEVLQLETASKPVCSRDTGREMVAASEGSSSDVAEGCVNAAAAVMMDTTMGVAQGPLDPSPLTAVNTEGKDCGGEVQVVACFETIPSVPSPLRSMPLRAALPSLCDGPQASPGSLVLTLEKLVSVTEEGLKKSEEDTTLAQQSCQIEEHRCHTNRLSKEQLAAVGTELQKRVKVLQQRHRRHLDKLLGLESLAAQLRQSNLLLEERLQLLEKAYLRTSTAVSDTGETVAIIYEDDSASYLWTQTDDEAQRDLFEQCIQ